tara:strand:- start:82 stop:567 length:486 start_codon:yes stop_codon:yes gene_type:complete
LKQKWLMMVLIMAVSFDARSEGLKPEERLTIADIMSSYALSLDTKDYPLLRSLFAVDVEVMMIFDSNSPDGGEIKLTGIDAWIEFVEQALDGTRASQHLLGNPVIKFNGERAIVRTDLQATEYYKDTKKPKTTVWGVYETHMVKDKNWKIIKHTLTSIGSE